MARIVNQEEHLNNPLEDFISFPDPISEEDKKERAKALGQNQNNNE
ncbi:hypothetical protein LQZ24_02175 [Fructobacillus sp. M1-13]|uniref:Uncharacterized protein n=1 Tax=Fructobacillus papyriferae TaxID=2713171 RepID=A0ABS5QP40_9LACO|nr:hypothetical protein [Fructobacillus papyriferae]MBS9334845.1 hypothetical protein [Fructobacillus papyriferae]MCD2158835.1 hypothetical protein [Fructobacillus papyriferae]